MRRLGIPVADMFRLQVPNTVPKLEPSMAATVRLFGPQAASWLVWTHRKSLHVRGQIDFHIPKSEVTPPWFRVAFECLRRRKGWTCVRQDQGGNRHYRIIWMKWGKFMGES